MSFGIRLSISGLAGVTLGVLSSAPYRLGIAIGVAAATLAMACDPHHRGVRVVCLWAAVVAMAFAYGANARDCALMPLPEWILRADAPVSLEGRLQRDASVGESGVRLEIGDTRVSLDDRTIALPHLDVLAVVGGSLATASVEQWTAGRRVRMPARLRTPAVVRNPGSPTVRWQELTRPFDTLATVKSGVLVDSERGWFPLEMAAASRRYVRRVCRQWLAPLGEQSAAVITAILVGDRAGLDDEVVHRLQAAGTFHVIAISGGNVAILTMLSLMVLRLLFRHERAVVSFTLIVVVAYGVVVGRDASVVRALLAATLYLGLRLCGLVPKPLNVLALTALISVIVEPLSVLDVGAWLSFGATLGLVTVLPRLLRSTVQHSATVKKTTTGQGIRRAAMGVLKLAAGLLLATAAAEVMILPVMASVFMRVGIAGLPLNFVAIPAMTVAQIAGLALCAAAPWWQGAASWAAAIAHWATTLLIGSASLVEAAPWLSWRVPPPPMLVVIAYYSAIALAMNWSGRRIVIRGAVCVAAICGAGLVTAPWTIGHLPPRGWLRITVVDVGQGESVAVQLPNRHAFLVDAGGSSGAFDVGGRIVAPALWASGIRRLDWLAMSHGDVDHAGGAIQITEDFRPAEIWEGVPVPGAPLIDGLRRASTGIVWRRVFAGHEIESAGARIDVLHPRLPDWERRRVRNDDSVVLRLRFGLVEVLLTGDAGPEFESLFAQDASAPPIRLLKVGHHGSQTSTSDSFLDAYAPTAALVSAGQGNLFGHPAPVVIGRLSRRGIDVFRTDRDGAIVIETDGRAAFVRSQTGRLLSVTSRAATTPPSLP